MMNINTPIQPQMMNHNIPKVISTTCILVAPFFIQAFFVGDEDGKEEGAWLDEGTDEGSALMKGDALVDGKFEGTSLSSSFSSIDGSVLIEGAELMLGA